MNAGHAAISISPPEIRSFVEDDAMGRVTAGPDLSTSSVSLKIAAAITATALGMGGIFWTTTGGLREGNAETRATLQIVLTKIDAAADISRVREENTKAQLDAMKKEMESMRGKSDLLQLQLQQLQLKLEGRR